MGQIGTAATEVLEFVEKVAGDSPLPRRHMGRATHDGGSPPCIARGPARKTRHTRGYVDQVAAANDFCRLIWIAVPLSVISDA